MVINYKLFNLKNVSRIKLGTIHLIGCMLIVLFTTCKNEVTPSTLETGSFIHVFPANGNQTLRHIRQTPDGGYIIVGSEGLNKSNDNLRTFVLKVSAAGKFEKKDTVSNEAMNTPKCSNLDDGGILINTGISPGFFFKVDKNLKKGPVYRYTNALIYQNSPAIEKLDGSFQLTMTNGMGTSAASSNYVLNVSANGLIDYFQIQDSSLGVKAVTFDLYRSNSNTSYFFTGIGYKDWQGNWNSIRRIFVAKLQYQGLGLIARKTLIIEPQNFSEQVYAPLLYINTSDNHLILAIRKLGLHAENKVQLVKVDSNLNIIWQKALNISIKGTYTNDIIECPDGHYLVAGSCTILGKLSYQPFACKIDRNGNIIWSQIYNTAFGGSFTHGLQISDGSYVFAGNTTGFGEGSQEGDVFIIKTDKDGNLN